jgi:magnesium transporter
VVGEIVEGLEGAAQRQRIAELRAGGKFFWIDVPVSETSRDDLRELLEIPEHSLQPLLSFGQESAPSRKFHTDGQRVVFSFSCYLESATPTGDTAYRLGPVEVHVLVSGDFVLTVHREQVSLPERLALATPEGRSEQYLVYAILDAMVASDFDALSEAEDTLEDVQGMSTDLRAGRVKLTTFRGVNARLSELRRRVGPQRGVFERISVEIGRLEGLGADTEHYFEHIGQQLNRLVEAIDAASQAMATLIDLRLNETTYWLTVVATVFLPLTFLTGFFGMNFGWLVEQIDTQLAFWLLGVGTLVVGVAFIWRLIVRGSPTS